MGESSRDALLRGGGEEGDGDQVRVVMEPPWQGVGDDDDGDGWGCLSAQG